MVNLDFYYFTFSTYLLMIGIAFIIAFILFYNITKKEYKKLDIFYVYVLNIFGFGIGAKILSFLSSGKSLVLMNFFRSGYAFLGGILGSIVCVCLYCKKYKLEFEKLFSKFVVTYPLIYSISKIGCWLNSCCSGEILNIPLQIVDSVVMFFLTLWLIKIKESNRIHNFLFAFGTFRFLEDFIRVNRKLVFGVFSLDQIICIVFVIWGYIFMKKNKEKANASE